MYDEPQEESSEANVSNARGNIDNTEDDVAFDSDTGWASFPSAGGIENEDTTPWGDFDDAAVTCFPVDDEDDDFGDFDDTPIRAEAAKVCFFFYNTSGHVYTGFSVSL